MTCPFASLIANSSDCTLSVVFVRVLTSLIVVRVPFWSIRLRVKPFELMLMIAGSRRLCMWSVYGNSRNWDVVRCHRVSAYSVSMYKFRLGADRRVCPRDSIRFC